MNDDIRACIAEARQTAETDRDQLVEQLADANADLVKLDALLEILDNDVAPVVPRAPTKRPAPARKAAAKKPEGGTHSCRYCDFSSRSAAGLNQHRKTQHPDVGDHRCTEPGCGRAFDTPLGLSRHQRTHDGATAAPAPEPDRPPLTSVKPPPDLVRCEDCDEHFAPDDLDAHRAARHPAPPVAPVDSIDDEKIECPECDAPFRTHARLNQHLRNSGHGAQAS